MFNDEFRAYKPWILFCIFVSILVLISGVVLLTHKKPEPRNHLTGPSGVTLDSLPARRKSTPKGEISIGDDDDDHESLRPRDEGNSAARDDVLWQVGDASEDEGDDTASTHKQVRASKLNLPATSSAVGKRSLSAHPSREHITTESSHNINDPRRSVSSSSTLGKTDNQDPFRDNTEEFGEWSTA